MLLENLPLSSVQGDLGKQLVAVFPQHLGNKVMGLHHACFPPPHGLGGLAHPSLLPCLYSVLPSCQPPSQHPPRLSLSAAPSGELLQTPRAGLPTSSSGLSVCYGQLLLMLLLHRMVICSLKSLSFFVYCERLKDRNIPGFQNSRYSWFPEFLAHSRYSVH